MRQSFIQAVKQMDPMDALVLKAIHANGGVPWVPNGRDALRIRLDRPTEEVVVSLEHLAELGCIFFRDSVGGGFTPIPDMSEPFVQPRPYMQPWDPANGRRDRLARLPERADLTQQ
jgi:hypothetical protein